MYIVMKYANLILLYVTVHYFQHYLMRRLSFLSHIHLLCCRLVDHRCLGLFLGSLFCSINYVFVCLFFALVPASCCFYYYGFVV